MCTSINGVLASTSVDGGSELICRQGMVSNLLPDSVWSPFVPALPFGPRTVHSRKPLRADPSHGDRLYSLDICRDGHIERFFVRVRLYRVKSRVLNESFRNTQCDVQCFFWLWGWHHFNV